MKHLFHSRERAFTLVELLVAVAIVAVLIGLAFLNSRSAVERGQSAKCMNNMRQIYLALTAYLQDNDNRLMQRYYREEREGYHAMLRPYVSGETRIFTCPSQRYNVYPAQPGYGLNWYYDNQSAGVVEQPSKTILIAESYGTRGEGSNRADRDSRPPGRIDKQRHGGVSNYLFFDGHAQTMEYSRTKEPLYASQSADGQRIMVDMWGVDHGDHSR